MTNGSLLKFKLLIRRVTFVVVAFLGGTTAHAQNIKCDDFRPPAQIASLSKLNPSPQVVGPLSLPTHQNTLFRGAYSSNPQFSFAKVLRGLLGERNWYIGSPMFWGITQVLTQQKSLDSTFIPSGGLPLTMKDYFEARSILTDVEALLKCSEGKAYSTGQAEILASQLMDKYFTGQSEQTIIQRYLDMSHPNYYVRSVQDLGLGNNAVDFIISSVYDQIAALYGNKTLVFKDTRNRAVDLAFWNYANNGFFYHHWVDAGEINTPGYLKSDELLGFQQRLVDRPRAGWGRSLIASPIDYAIYKVRHQNQDYVLLLDGNQSLCILQGSDSRFYSCDTNWADLASENTSLPSVSKETASRRIPIMGVIALCNQAKSDCKVPDSLWSWYGKTSRRAVPPQAIQEINSVQINGKTAALIAAQIPADEAFDGIQVVSATYRASGSKNDLGNVTAAAGAFLNGKTKEEYKVNFRFLGLKNRIANPEFNLEWICGHSPKNKKSHSISSQANDEKFIVDCEP